MYKYIIEEKDIPSDLEDYFDNDDIMFYNCGDKFDLAMIERGFFDYGIIRRSHRVITDFFKSFSIEDIKKSLKGEIDINMPINEVSEYEKLIEDHGTELLVILDIVNTRRKNIESSTENIDYRLGMQKALNLLTTDIEDFIEKKKIYLTLNK